MKVKAAVYTTPRPKGWEGEEMKHARIASKGTRRLNELCDELIPLGLNSAQIKGVLDGVSRYVARSLKEGYHVELDGLGIFSLSVSSRKIEKESGDEVMRVAVNGVNFRYSKQLKDRVEDAELLIVKDNQLSLTLDKRKQQMIDYLKQKGSISRAKYALLNGCSGYQADKDIRQFLQEGLIIASGQKTHKVYLLSTE